mmetsp:Transcript_45296/g.84478  ORF Transcript_45296/g.84478 Transcript_45296/m.84478 type:complete len:121 (-) Transcript_45296:10-372(-)
MQDAINSYQEKSEEPFQCRELDFLGAIKVNASVKFQEDEVLNCLVGTLAVTSFISQVKLTEKKPCHARQRVEERRQLPQAAKHQQPFSELSKFPTTTKCHAKQAREHPGPSLHHRALNEG